VRRAGGQLAGRAGSWRGLSTLGDVEGVEGGEPAPRGNGGPRARRPARPRGGAREPGPSAGAPTSPAGAERGDGPGTSGRAEDPPPGRWEAPAAAVVTRAWQETPAVRALELRLTDEGSWGRGFRPGQWVDIWHEGSEAAAGLSPWSTPRELAAGGVLRLGVRASGHPTVRWLQGARPGDEVRVRVGGTAALRGAHAGRAVFLAGGIGVTPLLSMARHLYLEGAGGGAAPEGTLLYAARTRADLAFAGELDACAAASGGRFRWEGVVEEERGRVTAGDVRAAVGGRGDAARATAYLCGPPGMSDWAEGVLLGAGVRPDAVVLERWW